MTPEVAGALVPGATGSTATVGASTASAAMRINLYHGASGAACVSFAGMAGGINTPLLGTSVRAMTSVGHGIPYLPKGRI